MKASERIESLEKSNLGQYIKNNKLQSELKALRFDVAKLEAQNEALKKEQQEFQEELKKEIDKIRQMKGFARWWNAGKLIWQLISTIESGFKE